MVAALEEQLERLKTRGVHVVDPRQTYVDQAVDLERISAGVVLHPGTRLLGARTFLGPDAEVGAEGPAVLKDCILGKDARIDSGYAEAAVLLQGARAGSNAHLRAGTLLEERASTAHSVGLKMSILGPFVTLGSLINFCDVLMMGGRSESDHSEVGSGFIHFNFTPFGKRGDKATPSLVGDVPHGVLLRRSRIFLGGGAGMVGPRTVGFGAVTAAGQVVRQDVADDHFVAQVARAIQTVFNHAGPRNWRDVGERNVRFMAELHALKAWYEQVRLAGACSKTEGDDVASVYKGAVQNIEACIGERENRLRAFMRERQHELLEPVAYSPTPCPIADVIPVNGDYIAWVRGLPDDTANALMKWLQRIVGEVVDMYRSRIVPLQHVSASDAGNPSRVRQT